MTTDKLIIADSLDVVSYVLINTVTTQEVLNWVYTGLLILSLVLGIWIKIRTALKDKKITDEEIKEIKEEIDKEMKEVEEQKQEGQDNGIHDRND